MNIQTYFTEDGTDCIPERDESNINIKNNENPKTGNDLEHLEGESETDWAEGNDLFGNSCVFSLVEESSYQNGLIEELQDKIISLEESCHEANIKCQKFKEDNEKLNAQLHIEQQRSANLQKKLKYIQDNQEIFNKLKKAYLNVKYNEAAGRPMIEIEEKGCQVKCPDANPLNISSNEISVKISDIEDIQRTVSNIKKMVDAQRKLQNDTSTGQLEYMLKSKDKEIEELLKKNSTLMNTVNSKESSIMKRIILKLEKQQRKLEIENNLAPLPSILNEREKNVVQQIILKCTRKVEKCNEMGNKDHENQIRNGDNKRKWLDLNNRSGEKEQRELKSIQKDPQIATKNLKKSNLVIKNAA